MLGSNEIQDLMEVANHAMCSGILIGIAVPQAEEGVEASLSGGIAFSLVVADEGDLINSCAGSSDQELPFSPSLR